MKYFGLPKSRRLRGASDFARVYERRQRLGDENLLIFGVANGLGRTRMGLSVSRKHGNAVHRTKLKRLLREAFRLAQQDVPQGLDLILIPRLGTVTVLSEYQRSLSVLTLRLAKRVGLVQKT